MVANCLAKSQFRDLSLIQYNSGLLLRGKAAEERKQVVPLSLWERVRVRA
jgi:hypothetical protein